MPIDETIPVLDYDIPRACRFCSRYFDGVCEKGDGVNYDPFELREPTDGCGDFIQSSTADEDYQEEMGNAKNGI